MKMPPHIMAMMMAGALVGTAGLREKSRPRPKARDRKKRRKRRIVKTSRRRNRG